MIDQTKFKIRLKNDLLTILKGGSLFIKIFFQTICDIIWFKVAVLIMNNYIKEPLYLGSSFFGLMMSGLFIYYFYKYKKVFL